MSAPDTKLITGTIAPYTKLTAQISPELVSTDSSMTFHNANREVLRITNEARLVIGEGLSKEEATQEVANLLITAFDEQIQKMIDARAAAELTRIRAEVERLKGCCDELHTIIDNEGYPSGKDYAAMIVRAEKAEADSKRLDWMEKYDWSNGFGDEVLYVLIQHRMWNGYELPSLRAAIDAAMKEDSK